MAFTELGYIARLRVSSPEDVAQYRLQFDSLEARVGREVAQVGLIDQHFTEPFILELATHPLILDAVETILGPDFSLLATHFFCKYGGESEKFVAWHQDITYWGLEPPIAVTAWYAIDDADQDNGCMRVIPASHRGGIREHGKAQQKGNLLSINQEVLVSAQEEAQAVDLPLKAGEVSLHDGCLIHGSLPNLSDRRRCGLTLRYVPTCVKQSTINSQGKRWAPILVRGVDQYRHFSPGG